ncbi:hypothetical protein C8R44DRAFT_752901 [Mycena epipterygia]|nr:hypothetical protein C8R44DRAFT_752901 [Mycena epipterygia]
MAEEKGDKAMVQTKQPAAKQAHQARIVQLYSRFNIVSVKKIIKRTKFGIKGRRGEKKAIELRRRRVELFKESKIKTKVSQIHGGLIEHGCGIGSMEATGAQDGGLEDARCEVGVGSIPEVMIFLRYGRRAGGHKAPTASQERKFGPGKEKK